MPTKRGWEALIAGVAIFAVGRLLGVRQLYELAVLLVTVVVIAVVSAVSSKPKVSIRRAIENPRLESDTPIRLELKLSNSGKRPTPTLRYVEKVPPELGGDVTVILPPLKAARSRSMRLELKPRQRGAYHIGPGTLSKTDAFGLASWTHASIAPRKIVVYPMTVELDHLDVPGGLSPAKGRRRLRHVPAGNEFYALRAFQEGDDERKIHWPSTARTGRTMVRQEEQSGQLIVRILLDPSAADAEEYERCVSSAASVLRCFHKRGYPTSLAIGPVSYQAGDGAETYHLMMEKLATSCNDLDADTSKMWNGLGEGFNVISCTRPHPELIRRLSKDRDLARRTLLIVHRQSRARSSEGGIHACRRAGCIVLETARLGDLQASWKKMKDAPKNAVRSGR